MSRSIDTGLDFLGSQRPTDCNKENTMKTKNQAQMVYKDKKAEIKKLLKSIEAGIEKHDRKANQDRIHWGHVGDMNSIRAALQEVSDQLHGTGEYAEVGKTW
jgi:hypothetical protein